MAIDDGSAWTDQAVAGLVGQTPRFMGQPAEVLAAWKANGSVVVRLRVEEVPRG